MVNCHPSLFPLSYYHYCRIYLGFQSLSTERPAFFGFCMKDRSLPGVKGGVCITIAVTGKGGVWDGLGWITHYQCCLTASTKYYFYVPWIGKGYRMKRQRSTLPRLQELFFFVFFCFNLETFWVQSFFQAVHTTTIRSDR
jgi:hypothetical protein